MTIIHNVRDRRRGWIGSWETEPLDYDKLEPEHVGRTVIYRTFGTADAGTITSWRDGIVFARYGRGTTAAGALARDLVLGIKHLDGPLPPFPPSVSRNPAHDPDPAPHPIRDVPR